MALIDSLRDIYGPYLWEPGTGGPSLTLSDSGGIGHAVAYDRAFDLTVTGQGDGLALIALADLDQASHVTLRAQVIAGDIGLGIQTLASPLWVQNFGTIQGTTAIYATTDGPGLLRIDNGGQIIGEVGIDTWLGAELRNLAGGRSSQARRRSMPPM